MTLAELEEELRSRGLTSIRIRIAPRATGPHIMSVLVEVRTGALGRTTTGLGDTIEEAVRMLLILIPRPVVATPSAADSVEFDTTDVTPAE